MNITPEAINSGELEQRLNDLENKEKFVFNPLFIPYFLSIKKKFKLSHLETLIYGFVYFYLKNTNEKFTISNQHLSKMLDISEIRISSCISKLVKKQLIKVEYEIKAGGGKVRKITLVK